MQSQKQQTTRQISEEIFWDKKWNLEKLRPDGGGLKVLAAWIKLEKKRTYRASVVKKVTEILHSEKTSTTKQVALSR